MNNINDNPRADILNLYGFLFFSFAVILSLTAGLRPLEIFRDTQVYLEIINSPTEIWKMEPTVWLINQLSTLVFGGEDQGFFLIYAALGVSIKIYAIRKLSMTPILSVYLYICLYFVLHEMTQIRVGVACGIFLLSIPDMISRNYKRYFFKCAIAISFHYSAVIMILLYFIDPAKLNKKVYYTLPALGVFISLFPDLVLKLLSIAVAVFPSFISAKVNVYLDLMSDDAYNKINTANLFILSLLIFYYFALYNSSRLVFKADTLLIKLFGIQIFIYYALSSVPAFSIRLSEFVGVCLVVTIPHFVFLFKDKYLPAFLIALWGGGYFWFISFGRLIDFK